MQTVLYLPGLLGSNLAVETGSIFGPRRLWRSFSAMFDGGLSRIQLGPDGASPGPLAQGIPCRVDGQLTEVYGPLGLWLSSQGFDCHALAFDWRLSLLTSADALAALIATRFAHNGCSIVAHSMGGLVARLAMRVLRGQGLDNLVRKCITLGTPQYGSFAIPQTFAHLDASYFAIASAGSVAYGANAYTSIQYLDSVLASMPGLYELLPFKRSGPFSTQPEPVINAMYSIASYQRFNPYVSQLRLDSTQAAQQLLRDAIWTDKQITLIGIGHDTPDNVTLDYPLNDRRAYHHTQQGDGRVPAAYATLPGVRKATINADHSLMPLLPQVWLFIRAALLDQVQGDARI